MRWERWLYTLPLRIRSLFRRADLETELDEELRYNVDRQTEANIATSMTEAEARHAALRSMGGIERSKEECRDAFGWRVLDTLRRDGKHAIRRLAKDWQFSAGAIVILALGVGANTAVFSILNNTLFQPNPFATANGWSTFIKTRPRQASRKEFPIRPFSTCSRKPRICRSRGFPADGGQVSDGGCERQDRRDPQ